MRQKRPHRGADRPRQMCHRRINGDQQINILQRLGGIAKITKGCGLNHQMLQSGGLNLGAFRADLKIIKAAMGEIKQRQ